MRHAIGYWRRPCRIVLEANLVEYLHEFGHQVLDIGTYGTEPVDYPDFAEAVANSILDELTHRAFLICGSGVGASVATNKLPGIRAGLCHDTYSARQEVEHDDIDILVIGARVIGIELARELIRAFLGAEFTGEKCHCRRLEKIRVLEAQYGK